MLKKPASGVLASLRSSTYRVEPLGYRNHWRGFSVRQDLLYGRTAHTKCGLYLLASSLVAALLTAFLSILHCGSTSLIPVVESQRMGESYKQTTASRGKGKNLARLTVLPPS